jgi:hypothetical protein
MARLPIIVPEEAKGKARSLLSGPKETWPNTQHDTRHGQFARHTRSLPSIQFCA